MLLLTDGVYAIALTLLALDLRLPPEAEHLGGAELLAALIGIWPKLLGYLTSFTVIGLYWSLHHRTLGFIHRCDGGFVWLSLLHMGCIAFLPFPTAVIGEHIGDVVAEEFYFGSLAVTTVVSAAIWWYATWNHRLVEPDLGQRIIRSYRVLAVVALLGLLALMGLIPLGLARVVEPLVVGYLLTLGFIVEGVRDRRSRQAATHAGA